MGRIIILENVVHELTSNPHTPYTLFGSIGLVRINDTQFDLFFSVRKHVMPQKTRDGVVLALPVLPWICPEEVDQARLEIGQLYGMNPKLTRFIARDRSKKLVTVGSRSEEESGITLRFFTAKSGKAGIEISDHCDYTTERLESCRQKVPHWNATEQYIHDFRLRLQKQYGS